MKRIVAATIALLFLAFTPARAQAPTPPAEAKRMAYFAGTWNFSGEAKAGPMGPAGPVSFKEVCELMPGGFSVVCRSDGKGPTGPTRAVSIMTYDAERKAYSYTAAESNSPVITATGQLKGSAWNWRSEGNMGGKKMTIRVTVTEGGPNAYDFLMELSVDGGAFTQLISGKATRAA
jgi:hypothetical protein